MSTVQHSMCQTTPYISHVVDKEVMTLTCLVNALLVLQSPTTGPQGTYQGQLSQGRTEFLVAGLVCAARECRQGQWHS